MIGNRLKLLREEMCINQEQLAQRLSVSPSAIGMYERNKREPNNEILLKIAEYFNVSTDYLLGKSDVRKTDIEPPINNKINLTGLDDNDLKEIQNLIDHINFIKEKINKRK